MKITISVDEYIGRKVKSLRKKHSMTQRDLAKMLKISHMGISHYETGTRPWKVTQLAKIAKVFNKDLLYFIK